jgi:hypothetical protein
MPTTYLNSWYKPNHGDPLHFTTEAKPVECEGFLVYERIKGQCWDYVKDGVCVAQYAGFNGKLPENFYMYHPKKEIAAKIKTAKELANEH